MELDTSSRQETKTAVNGNTNEGSPLAKARVGSEEVKPTAQSKSEVSGSILSDSSGEGMWGLVGVITAAGLAALATWAVTNSGKTTRKSRVKS